MWSILSTSLLRSRGFSKGFSNNPLSDRTMFLKRRQQDGQQIPVKFGLTWIMLIMSSWDNSNFLLLFKCNLGSIQTIALVICNIFLLHGSSRTSSQLTQSDFHQLTLTWFLSFRKRHQKTQGDTYELIICNFSTCF